LSVVQRQLLRAHYLIGHMGFDTILLVKGESILN
jgi:hypothetical protein